MRKLYLRIILSTNFQHVRTNKRSSKAAGPDYSSLPGAYPDESMIDGQPSDSLDNITKQLSSAVNISPRMDIDYSQPVSWRLLFPRYRETVLLVEQEFACPYLESSRRRSSLSRSRPVIAETHRNTFSGFVVELTTSELF